MEARYQKALARICGGRDVAAHSRIVSAALVCEPANARDSNGVQVVVDGLLVGYLSKEETHALGPLLMAMQRRSTQVRCAGEIVGKDHRGRAEPGTFAFWLRLPGPGQIRA